MQRTRRPKSEVQFEQDAERFLRSKLSEDIRWALRALLVMMSRQTPSEENTRQSREINKVGFTKIDASILTGICNQYKDMLDGKSKRRSLSQKQVSVVKSRMPKYWRQLFSVSDRQKLKQCMQKELSV